MKNLSLAVAAAALALSFTTPVYAQAPTSAEAVVAACAAGGDCAAITAAYVRSVPAAQRGTAIGAVTVALGNAAVQGTVSRSVAAAGVSAASGIATGSQKAALETVVATLNAPASTNGQITTASTAPGASSSGI